MVERAGINKTRKSGNMAQQRVPFLSQRNKEQASSIAAYNDRGATSGHGFEQESFAADSAIQDLSKSKKSNVAEEVISEEPLSYPEFEMKESKATVDGGPEPDWPVESPKLGDESARIHLSSQYSNNEEDDLDEP